MKRLVLPLAVGASLGLSAAARQTFSSESAWEPGKSYENRCTVSYGTAFRGRARDVLVSGKITADTAWCAKTRPVAVPDGSSAYRLAFRLLSDCVWFAPRGGGDWTSGLVWSDASGAVVTNEVLELRVGGGRFHDFAFGGRVPAGARSVAVRFGNDTPNISKGDHVAIDDVALEFLPTGSPVPATVLPGILPPAVTVRLLNAGPLRSGTDALELAFDAGKDVVLAAVRVGVDGKPLMSRGTTVPERLTVPGSGWSEGLHRLDVEMTDGRGDRYGSLKWFRVGGTPQRAVAALRDDGMTLVDGQAVFPIGIYGICRREFNAFDVDRAFADLRAAGFDFGHSYYLDRDPAFYAAAAKYGFRLWTDARQVTGENPETWIQETGRAIPSIVAWYLADDTSDNTSVQLLQDRADTIRLTDGTRLTCQADGVGSDRAKSRYADYAASTDVFIPEIYPVCGEDPEKDRACVATVLRDMACIKADLSRQGLSRRGIWPVLQHFKGYGSWKDRPTADQLYAMSVAAIVGGANGLSWYTYGGNVASGNYGVVATREAWTAMTNVTRRLSAVRDVLAARDAAPMTALEVLSGPATNRWGGATVACLTKRHEGRLHVFAVNATDREVRAAYPLPAGAEAEVLWENRRVKSANGVCADMFKPYGVHVLVIDKGVIFSSDIQ